MKKVAIVFIGIILMLSCKKNNDLFSYLETFPVKAELVFPNSNSECTEGIIVSPEISEVNFLWNESANTDNYIITVTNLVDKTSQIFTTENLNMPINLQRGTPYSWSVESTSVTSTRTAISDVWNFYNAGEAIDAFIPFPAETVSPVAGSTLPNTTTTITLDWNGSDLDNDIANFDVYFGTSNPPAEYEINISASQLNNIPVTSGMTYYWRILTRDITGNISNSEITTFAVN